MEEGNSWNYMTWLNIGFLVLAALLAWRFFRTGGPEMLRMLGFLGVWQLLQPFQCRYLGCVDHPVS